MSIMGIINDYQSGVGLYKLAAKYHMCWKSIRTYLINNNVTIRQASSKKFNINDAVIRYSKGATIAELAILYGVAENAIKSRFKHDGHKFRNHKSYYKYYYDLSKLMDLSNEVGAYWYGFLLADGSLKKSHKAYSVVNCTLAWRDKEHLKKLVSILNVAKPVKSRYRLVRGKRHRFAIIEINSKELCDFYLAMGWNKFKKGEPALPDELNLRHFLRGVWDGDGCVSYRSYINKKYLKMSYADMSYDITNKIQDLVVKLCEVKPHTIGVYKTKGWTPNKSNGVLMYRCGWTGKPAEAVAKVLYSNCGIMLDRKANKIGRISPGVLSKGC